MAVILPVAVDGILATSLSVKTSQRSWYCRVTEVCTYFLNTVADFHEPLLDRGFFGALAKIGQLDVDVCKVTSEHSLHR